MATPIVIANTDWTIINAVDTAITAATVSGDALFDSVTLATSEAQAKEAQMKGDTPRVIMLLGPTEEFRGVYPDRYCKVSIDLFVAGKKVSGVDEATRLQEIYRLANGVKNAVEAGSPAAAHGYGDTEGEYHPKGALWGELDPAPTEEEKQPWIAFRLPVSFGYTIASAVSH